MKITILAVGSEAQYQPTFDTAYQYLKKETAALSAELSYAICRPDAAELFAALRNAMGQSEAVVLLLSPEPAAVSTALRVVCGGLERTAQTDAALQKQLEARAARMGLTLGYEQLADFASCPSGATQLPNAQGLVQGYAIAARRQLLMALPALPGELSALYPSAVRPLLGKLAGLAVSYATVRVLELDQFSVPQEITRLSQNPHLRLTSRHQCGDYTIFVEATGATQQEAEEYLQRAITHMQQTFGIYLYCIGDRPLPQIAVDGMTRHGLTLSTAEWGTGDLLREQLSAVIGANSCYRASYDDTHIGQELELPRRVLQNPAENAALIAGLLAQQSRKAGHTALGLGLYCQPESGQLHVALADKNRIWNRRLSVTELRREDTQQIAVWQALNVLRLYTAQYPKQLPGGIEPAELDKRAGIGSLFACSAAKAPKSPANTSGKEPKASMEKKIRTKTRTAAAEPAAEAVKGTNLIQRIKMKSITKNDKIRIILLAVCIIVFLASGIYIINNKLQSIKNKNLSDELAGLYDPDGTTDISVDGYPKDYIRGFEALYQRNPDIAGWVKIPDTKLDYAVVQAEDNDKYHRADIDGKYNDWGIPYVDFRVDQSKPSYNTVIYGHNMGDGTMFGYLQAYKKLSYYQQHPLISYNSVYRKDMYKIFAVVVCKADDPDFDYHNFIDSDSDAAKNEYIEKIMKRSIIKTTVDVKASDRLLTLSTCDYTFRDPDTNKLIARLVIFGRALRDGESEAVNVNAATLNPNPLMPKQWYEYIKKQQEKKAAEELEKEQKAYIELWLTEEEIVAASNMTTAELYEKAQERAAQAERCMTAEELAEGLTPKQIKERIEYRQKLFAMLLTQDETDGNTASKKLALCQERLDILQQEVTVNGEKKPLFDDNTLFASKWSQLQARYELLSKQKDWKTYLSVADVQNLNIAGDALKATLTANQQRAQKYLTPEQIGQYNNWHDLSAAIAKAEATRKALEAEGLKAGLTQAEMDKMSLSELQKAVDKAKNKTEIEKTIADIKVLNPNATGSNGTALSDMTLDELKALLSALQQERATLEAAAKAAGMTADEIKKYPSNAELQQAINEKQKAQREDLIKQIQKYDPSYDGSNKTLEQLVADLKAKQEAEQQKQNLINDIKALAAELGESVDENALKGMTYDQLVAKNQELQQKKAESQRQANLAAIAKLDPDAAAALKDADANAVSAKLNEVNNTRASLESTASGLGIDSSKYPTNADLAAAIEAAKSSQQPSGGEGQNPASESGETPTP